MAGDQGAGEPGPGAAELRAAGFVEVDRVGGLLASLPGSGERWVRACSVTARPDEALLQAVRLAEADPSLVRSLIDEGGRPLGRVLGVLGGSRALGDLLVSHPDRARALWETPVSARATMLGAVGAPAIPLGEEGADAPVAAPGATADDLRRAYRRVLLDIVGDDLTDPEPVRRMPAVGRALADLADAALEAALALARRDVDPGGRVRLTVVAMGKTGARELNYVSDVDVMYVAEAGSADVEEREVIEIGTRLAALSAQACSGPGAEPPLWAVDTALRPEGRDGALVRTLDSYQAYYARWAQTWEYQALLKARAAAGDRDLGARFEAVAASFVWSAAGRPGFVDNARAMRTRVEENIPRSEVDRELKLGPGGLRDVEFTVQLLQLVHGRTDPDLRVRDTVGALAALSTGGYVGRSRAAELTRAYCFLRTVEHRAQLWRMRRTHLVPSDHAELRAMARSIDPVALPSAEDLEAELTRVRTRVRALHEEVFYRPIVAATASLSPDEAALDRDAAMARLAAVGYIDPAGALAHITALTAGASRRAAIQRHLLPVFISWLADGADPDLGLLSFRSLSEQIGDSHWYLSLLRDSGVAATRLCRLLSGSRWIADALSHRPEAIAWLDHQSDLQALPVQRLRTEIRALVGRHPDAATAAERVRSVRARELTRAGMADGLSGVRPVRAAISDAADVALEGALAIAQREDEAVHGGRQADVALIAMGRYGGRESSYASDADVMVVHRCAPGVDDARGAAAAARIASRVRELLGRTTSQMGLAMDTDLRPEGRSGPVSRTVESYREYYQDWASPWEHQALLRARGAAGPEDLVSAFLEVVDPIRYQWTPSPQDLRAIRLLKARMENERLPRGADPARHVKLGPGGLTDVEWVVQLLQLRHAHDVEALRATSTMGALDAAEAAGLVDGEDAATLREAWSLASRIRAGNVLTSGRMSGAKLDVLPLADREHAALARLLGYASGGEGQLDEDWRRAARRSRKVMDRLFWE
jgi:glutamate-ammonia-ligase adenylyltransferase